MVNVGTESRTQSDLGHNFFPAFPEVGMCSKESTDLSMG